MVNYNYAPDGFYFVTIVANYRKNYFKDKREEVHLELEDLLRNTPGVELDYFVVMPNHVHIIFVLRGSRLRLGEIVRRFKSKVSHRFGINIWQPNYYEHVIRNEKALEKIREYIVNNPQELLMEFESFYK